MFPQKFKDKTVIVTGAGRGIGRAIALDFARDGGKIILVSRTKSELNDVCQAIKRSGGQCMAITADVSKESDVKKVFSIALESFGTVDILINNAGHGSENKSIVDVDTEEWDEMLDTNLRSIFLFSREALKIMIKKNYGKIINIASLAERK